MLRTKNTCRRGGCRVCDPKGYTPTERTCGTCGGFSFTKICQACCLHAAGVSGIKVLGHTNGKVVMM